MKIFIDDERSPRDAYTYTKNPVYLEDGWVVARSYDEFIKMFYSRQINGSTLISFDHDLGGEKSGLDCVKALIHFCNRVEMILPKFLCHSMNPVGKTNILCYLESYRRFQLSREDTNGKTD